MQGMAMVQKMGGKVVEMFSDSRLVVGQVTGEMEAKDVRMQEYLNQVKRLRSGFDLFSLSHIAEVATPTQTRWPHSLPPRRGSSLRLSSLNTWAGQVK